MMNFKNKELAINSILIVISTSILGTILHESAHYLTALNFGFNPELHHNYVDYNDNGAERQAVMVAAAGPLFSLISGLVFTYISIKIMKPSLSKLFLLWMGMGSILSFLGYVLIAPVAKNGDTGKVFDYLGIPIYVSITIAVVLFVFINWLFSKFSMEFKYYKNTAEFDQKETKKQLFLYPIWCSIIVVTILSFPIVTWVSLLPSIFMPMTYFSTMGAYRKLQIKDADVIIDKISVGLVVLTVLTIALFRYLV